MVALELERMSVTAETNVPADSQESETTRERLRQAVEEARRLRSELEKAEARAVRAARLAWQQICQEASTNEHLAAELDASRADVARLREERKQLQADAAAARQTATDLQTSLARAVEMLTQENSARMELESRHSQCQAVETQLRRAWQEEREVLTHRLLQAERELLALRR